MYGKYILQCPARRAFEPEEAMFIVDAWKGSKPLWTVFWLYGVVPSTIATGVFLWLVSQGASGSGLRQLLLAAFAPYTIWVLVAIWRAAAHAPDPLMGGMARGLTVAWAINATMLVVFAEMDFPI